MPLSSLSLQLYSVRHALDEDIPGTIARVAGIGFRQVESSYKIHSKGRELRDAIRDNGLTSPTMTASLVDVDVDPVFPIAVDLGAHTVIETFVPDQFWGSVDAVQHIADQLNAAAAKAADFGLRVAYHNHWWELEHRYDGKTALEALVDRLDPAVLLEVDAYWVAVGGQDPVDLVGRLSDRVHFLHLKDGPVNHDNSQQRPAGQGDLPIEAIIAAAPQLEVGVIEFDDYAGDVFDAVAQSFAYLDAQVPA
ncbi:sugar phosphate isomerase/epimerase family protein [Nakamurella endophytica]|uniref:Xylose isomerase n=1 Tax=Nakamurella endophytica TaxID=1748367 RepID=A0A917SV24_9ACTN|nr:sugar phosphate isomerase/epimerase [Nakamurella endophytica]GGL97873.1 xylose isomerase [Nakamurella endophytica]